MDAPINPINGPSTIIFPKSSVDPEEVRRTLLQKIGRSDRFSCKLKKVFGKYFFEKMNDSEYQKWTVTNTAVKYDIKSDKEIIEFGL